MSDLFGFGKLQSDFAQMKRDIPPIIGEMGQRFFTASFTKQGWDDDGIHPWEPRKDTSNTRSILIGKSGGTKNAAHVHLRSAVRDALQSSSWEEIKYVVKGVPYAEIHNEGGQGLAFGKYPFTMPQRQFIGASKTLMKQIEDRIYKEIKNIARANGFK